VSYRFIAAWAAIGLLGLLAQPVFAQRSFGQVGAPSDGPVPRWPDGHVMLGPPPGETGIWMGAGGAVPGLADWDEARAHPFPGRLKVSEVPYQPWARAVVAYRDENQFEPHARCKPSGGVRQFVTPYGNEIMEIRELERVYIFDVGGPHTFRIIYTDGREHPDNLTPTYYGHSIGHWEGDTLVVDTVGFNEKFWIDRRVTVHTKQLHLIERFTRTSLNRMEYDVTVDDPGAYTETWSGGIYLRWEPDQEMFEYICQEQNLAYDLMVGTQVISFFGNSRITP